MVGVKGREGALLGVYRDVSEYFVGWGEEGLPREGSQVVESRLRNVRSGSTRESVFRN